MLQEKKQLRIRNQTDMLNAMSKLEFEYINSFTARTDGTEVRDNVSLSDTKHRINTVFRKKEKFRKE